jgi:hypothetical protein
MPRSSYIRLVVAFANLDGEIVATFAFTVKQEIEGMGNAENGWGGDDIYLGELLEICWF